MKPTKAAFLAFIAAVLAMFFAKDVSGQGLAPMNTKFLEWQKRHAVETSQDTTNTPAATNTQRRASLRRAAAVGDVVEDGGFGLVPTLVDMDYLADINVGAVRAPAGGFPASYDLRTQNRLTVVRNQNPYGTCWAHATMASLESGVLGREGVAADFSENNMANLHGWDWGFDYGGNATIATAYLVRWGGPVNETDDIYPNPGGSSTMSPVRHVQKVVWIPGKSANLDNDAIKAAIMEHGALYVSYYHSSSYYKSSTSSYYYPGSGSGNHAVAIVGWNDHYSASNFVIKPAGNGAYLVRNSWGSGWGNSGYFWVSYYDGVFARSTMYSFCNAEATDNYGKIYQYDPLGAISHFSTPWGANLFTATGADKIAAVGFYALVPKTSYSLSIYKGCQSGRPTSGTLALSQSGTIDEPGFTTVPLSTSVSVTSGSRFSVVLKLTTPGYGYPQAIEYAYTGITSGANAADGQSFYSSNGSTWTDLTQWNGTANFCIKAYTESMSATVSLLSVSVSGPASVESGKTAKYACISRYTDNSEKTVSANWSVVSGSAYATIAADGTLTASETSVDRTVVIRVSYAEGGVTKTSDWALTVTAGPPPAPTGLSATQGTETRAVRISWDAVSGAENYAIYRSATSSIANALYLGVTDAVKFSDTTAVPGKDYWYFVKARNSSGIGPLSSGTTGWRSLVAPADAVASDGTSLDGVSVSWSSVEGAAAYKVWRSDDFDGDPEPISAWLDETAFFDNTAEPGAVHWYSVAAAVDSQGSRPSERSIPDDGFRAVPVVPASLDINGDTSITAGGTVTYSAYVLFSNGTLGLSPVSPIWEVSEGTVSPMGVVTAPIVSANMEIELSASITIEGVTISGTKTILVMAVVPTAPTGVVAVAPSPSQGVTVTWNAVEGASSYKIYRSLVGQEGLSPIGAVSETSFADTSAMPGVEYAYRVSALNGAGEGEISASATAMVPLTAPTGVTATKDLTNCVHLAWNAVVGATHYRVARATAAEGDKTPLGSWTAALSCDDVPPSTGTAYFYFVQAATDSAGANAGDWSASAEGLMKTPRILVALSISGPDHVPASGEAVYSCVAHWSDETAETVSPDWSVSPAAVGSIGHDGKFAAAAVVSNTTVTVVATYGGLQNSKTLTIVAPEVASATVTSVSAAQRWPFSGLVDIDYTLVTSPLDTKARISVSANDRDHGCALAATTLTGDGANGTVAAGEHRLTWNLAADHPGFHAKAVDVSVEAVPAKQVTVTFDGNGGTPSAVSMSGFAGDAYATLPTATRNGYTFLGWFTAAFGGTQITESSLADENITTLYAHWMPIAYDIALDCTNLEFTVSSGDWWIVQGDVTHDGEDALRCDAVLADDPASETISTTVSGPGEISFWWRIDNGGDDGFSIEFWEGGDNGCGIAYSYENLDGTLDLYWSDDDASGYHYVDGNWIRVIYNVQGDGEHSFKWLVRTMSAYGGMFGDKQTTGRAWLDQVVWKPAGSQLYGATFENAVNSIKGSMNDFAYAIDMPVAGSSYNGIEAGEPYGWFTGSVDDLSSVVACSDVAGDQCLKLQTEGGTLTNKLRAATANALRAAAKVDGAYFEADVKFVASDTVECGFNGGQGAPMFGLYAYAPDGGDTTNLVVFHACYDAGGGGVSYTNEVLGISIDTESFTRIRVEMKQINIDGASCNIFAVAVNGTSITSSSAYQDGRWFLAADSAASGTGRSAAGRSAALNRATGIHIIYATPSVIAFSNYDTILFKGTGEIDNISIGTIGDTTNTVMPDREKVQLWEGGPYWATTNIGAENPEDYGLYFWWGDTIGYRREGNTWVASNGSSQNFSFESSNTPTSGKDIATLQSEGWITADGALVPEHDAAHVYWGGAWRMPMEQELSNLNNNCDWMWTTTNGVNGYIVSGRGDYASASIFLPAAGYGYGTSIYNAESGGSFWSSCNRPDHEFAWILDFGPISHVFAEIYRCYGISVRPVQGFSE